MILFRYLIDKLQQKCILHMKKNMSSDNALMILHLAHELQLADLKCSAMKFVLNNVKTFDQLAGMFFFLRERERERERGESAYNTHRRPGAASGDMQQSLSSSCNEIHYYAVREWQHGIFL
jgi:hypothetical protein